MMRASGEDGAMSFAAFRKTVRHLYEGATPEGVRFRYALLAFDIVTVLFIIATSFLPSNDVTEALANMDAYLQEQENQARERLSS